MTYARQEVATLGIDVHDRLDDMTEREYQYLVAHVAEGQSLTEIARRQGCARETVRQAVVMAVHRHRAVLRKRQQ